MTKAERNSITPTEKTLEARDVTGALLKGAPLALLAMLLGGLGAFLATRNMQPVFQATTIVLAAAPPSYVGGIELVAAPQVDPRVFLRAILDGPVIPDALSALEGKPPTEAEVRAFKKNVRISIEDHKPVSSMLTIAVRGSDPEVVALQANSIAQALIDWDRGRAERGAEEALAAIEASIAKIDADISRAVAQGNDAEAQRRQAFSTTVRDQLSRELEAARTRKTGALFVSSLTQLEVASPEGPAIGPRVVFNAFIAAVAMLVLAYGIQIVHWSRDPRVGDGKRVSESVGFPVLGLIADRKKSKVSTRDPFVLTRATLLSSSGATKAKVFGVTSPTTFEEKRNVALGLARSMALAGYQTVIIDGDLQRQGTGYAAELSRGDYSTVEEHLADPAAPLRPARVMFNPGVDVDLIPTKESTRLNSAQVEEAMLRFFSVLCSQYDVVIVDLPPLLTSERAIPVGACCTATVMGIGARTREKDALQALELSGLARINTVGLFITGPNWSRSRGSLKARSDVRPVPTHSETNTARAELLKGPRALARVQQRGRG